MSSERVLLVGIKGSGKKTIQKSLHKFFPQLFTLNENNILCLDLAKNRVKKILSADTLKEVTIPVIVISCEREKNNLRFQEDFFMKFDKAIDKHAPETILLILVHKKDQFVDPIHKRDFLATCAKSFRRKRGKALIVSTSAKDYSIKRAFSKILKIRGALSLVAKQKIVQPAVKPPIPTTGLTSTSSPTIPPTPPVGSPVKPELPVVPSIPDDGLTSTSSPTTPPAPPVSSPVKPKLPVVPSIPDEKAEVPPIPPPRVVEAEDSGLQLEHDMESVDLTVQEEPEKVEEYEPLEPSLPPSQPVSIPTSDEKFSWKT